MICTVPVSLIPLKTPSLPIPVHLTTTAISLRPKPSASFKTCLVSISAAKGVFCLAPLYHNKPVPPPNSLSPLSVVRVTIVLLSVVLTCNTPNDTLISFFFAIDNVLA